MQNTLRVREIEDSDIEAVIALWHKSGVAPSWNPPERDIVFALRDTHSTILLGEAGDQLIASAMVGEDGHRGWVYYVAVDPEHQKSGLGREIMQAAENWLVARGCWKVQLLIRASNQGVKNFYVSIGYKDTETVCMKNVVEN